jgi:hypothetical protein
LAGPLSTEWAAREYDSSGDRTPVERRKDWRASHDAGAQKAVGTGREGVRRRSIDAGPSREQTTMSCDSGPTRLPSASISCRIHLGPCDYSSSRQEPSASERLCYSGDLTLLPAAFFQRAFHRATVGVRPRAATGFRFSGIEESDEYFGPALAKRLPQLLRLHGCPTAKGCGADACHARKAGRERPLAPTGDLPSENALISKQRTRVSKTVTGR